MIPLKNSVVMSFNSISYEQVYHILKNLFLVAITISSGLEYLLDVGYWMQITIVISSKINLDMSIQITEL
jgi:hypothetical protein